MREKRIVRSTLAAGISILGLGPGATTAGELAPVLLAEAEKIEVAQASQKRIDRIVDETENLETQYEQVTKELDGLRVYNDYLQRQIAEQAQELQQLYDSIDQVSSMERQIVPLMIRMLDALDQFVQLDVPFLHQERTDRVERLRATMDRADVSAAEKFRHLTEAYQIEIDYGRTIETYKDSLTLEGATLEVDVLRLGRIGLFYQTSDASATGMWDLKAKVWKPLTDSASRNQVRQGIRIAQKQIAPDLLLLKVPAPEASS